MLENKDFANTFGNSAGNRSFLKDLESDKEAVLLDHYYATGHNSLDNYITMISAEPATLPAQLDCPDFTRMAESDYPPSRERQDQIQNRLAQLPTCPTYDQLNAAEQDLRIGCVYPGKVLTLANQMEAHNPALLWRAYMEDMPENCAHPAFANESQAAPAAPPGRYAVKHNPFVFFQSLLDGGGTSSCKRNDVPLGAVDAKAPGLAKDLDSDKESFPNLVFISPNLCSDGHDACDASGQKINGLSDADARELQVKQIDQFLGAWVPKIRASRPYLDAGMIIITFDEADVEGCTHSPSPLKENQAASTDCCNQKPGPLALRPGIFGPGGGKIGAIILSPLARAGVNTNDFNHYSMLRSLEDMFGIHEHLGGANDNRLHTFQECGVFKSD